MKDFKKSHNIAGQSNKNVQKSQKHDANLQKNSSLYFQVGLILCLLATYGLFEMKFETKNYDQAVLIPLEDEDFAVDAKNYIPEPDAPKQDPVKQQKKTVIIDKEPVIVDNTTPMPETPDFVTAVQPTSSPIDPGTLKDPVKPEDDEGKIFDLINIEKVPIYPGCEKKLTNNERIKCMSDKLGKLIQKKFDKDLAAELGLYGVQKIYVQFKIDKTGKVTEVKARAPHSALEKEAKRVTGKIPEMEPGKQRDKPVAVMYNLPIVFKVN